MNKKFSTLMAGLMLASAFSVNAVNEQASGKYEDGKYYLLGSNGMFISVNSDPGTNYGKLSIEAITDNDLKGTREALWKVTVVPGKVGEAPKFAYQNVATGLYLNLSAENYADLKITGSYQEWNNGVASATINDPSPLMTYISADKVIYFEESGNVLSAKVAKPADAVAAQNVFEVEPYKANIVKNLSAEDLNKEFDSNATEGYFKLSFNKDVTEGASENLFAATELKAVQLYKNSADEVTEVAQGNIKLNLVRLQAKDVKADDHQAYIVVDTAYYTGSENNANLVKFTYAALNDVAKHPYGINRYERSFEYNFAYDPTEDRVLIRSNGYLTKTNNLVSVPTTSELAYADYEYDRMSRWTVPATDVTSTTDELGGDLDNVNAMPFVRLVELSSVRELTVSNRNSDASINEAKDKDKGMNTIVKIGTQIAYEPTTIDDGLYMIKLAKNDIRTAYAEDAVEGDYYIANLGGAFGYIAQAKNQDFEHMPAAQWYVKKDGTSNTARISITNREFSDLTGYGNLGGSYVQAFKAGEDRVFFTISEWSTWGYDRDTLEFVKVSDEIAKDAKLGYKYVDKEKASVEIYNFNYLHGLTLDNGLNTPTTDSLVRVDETGEKAAFRLEPVVVDDSYGIQLDEKKTGIANLVRNVYYVKAYDNSKFESDRYLKYDYASKKYVMSTAKQPFFLKENNCIDGTHYYALVEANLLSGYYPYYDEDGDYVDYRNQYYYDENGQPVVMDDSKNIALYNYNKMRLKIDAMPTTNPATWDDAINCTVDINQAKYLIYNKSADNNNEQQEEFWGARSNITNGVETIEYKRNEYYSTNYASRRISVDDNTLDLTQAHLYDKWDSEIRVSAFDVDPIDSPLYRRFNGENGEFGTAANAPLNLKFFRFNNDQEFLFENYSSENSYRDGIKDQSISFLGVNNAKQFEETATRSYTMYVDTAYVRGNTRMPQYLIAVKPEFVAGDTTLCDASTHQHKTPEEALACEHTQIKVGFTRAMYLFNAQDSIDNGNFDYQGKAAYGAAGYTRLAFRDAVHAQDTLYILNPGVTTEQLIATDLKDGEMFAERIPLDNNNHKDVVFQFRLIDSDNNRFLIESEADPEMVAPMTGGWVKVQNGVPVIARMDFNEAIRQADVFDVTDQIQYDATANDEIAVEGVSVVAGDGQVTIMGAAGKNVTITNILGKVIASQVIASDNATIAVPAGIVAVAVEGEDAVKAIVK